MALDWQKAQVLPWRQRNAEIEAALRGFLARCDPRTSDPLSTWELACALACQQPGSLKKKTPEHESVTKLSQILTRMAPYLGALAAHDGEDIIRYGRKWKRWQWYGQKREAA